MAKPNGTVARGYGAAHKREIERWRPVVNAGQAHCAQPICIMPNRWIQPGTPWHLGHTDDRTAYLGPVHALCNLSDGGRRARANDRRRGHTHTPRPWHSRTW